MKKKKIVITIIVKTSKNDINKEIKRKKDVVFGGQIKVNIKNLYTR